MSNELETSVIIDLVGNLERKARAYERAIQRMSRNGGRHMDHLDKKTRKMGKSFASMGRSMAAFATGAAVVGTGKKLLNLEERYERIGVAANIDTQEAQALRQKVYMTSMQNDLRVDANEVTGAIEEILEKTGDLKFAEQNIRNIALAIKATGAEGKDIGSIMSEFQKMNIKAPEKVLEALDILTVQGKSGAFTLSNLASLGSRAVTAYTATGRTDIEAIREMGAVLQVIRQGTGDSAMAVSAWEATLRTLSDPKKIQALRDVAGIEIFDEEQLKQGIKLLRPINEIMTEILEKSGGDQTKIATIFDAEALRSFNAMLGEYKRTKKLDSLDSFMNVRADGGTIIADATRISRTGNSHIQQASDRATALLDAVVTRTFAGENSRPGILPAGSNDVPNWFPKDQLPFGPEGKMVIEVEAASGTRGKIKSIESRGIELETGQTMVGQ